MRTISKIATAILAAATVITSTATPITPEQALEAVGKAPSRSRAAAQAVAGRLSLAYTAIDAERQQPVYYAFNNADGGFIIAAADDQATPLLAYSDSGSFDFDNIPDNMRVFLSTYDKEMKALRDGYYTAATSTLAQETYEPVAPLLGNILWDQGAPFNSLCESETGIENCATGCVATAFAQIMRHYRYPEEGSGSKTYTDHGESRHADFNTTYDWDLMLPVYNNRATKAEKEEVAKLMWHVGVASEMGYGESSGAFSSTAVSGLVKYFDYDKGAYIEHRDYWEVGEWSRMLRDEIAAGRPVSYAGYTGNWEGHQFVLDGYDADGLFHLNWGWSGASNGYFAISVLTPGVIGTGGAYGGFNYEQEAVLGLQPNCGTEVSRAGRLAADKITLNGSSMVSEAGSTATFNLGRTANIGYGRFEGNIAIGLFVDGELVAVGSPVSASLSVWGMTYPKPKFELPTLKADADVVFRPLQQYKDEDSWELMGTLIESHTMKASYVDGVYTFINPKAYDISVTDVTFENVFTDNNANLYFTFINDSDFEYKDALQFNIYDADNTKLVTKLEDELIDAAANEAVPVVFTTPISIAAGEYNLRINNRTGTTLATTPFTVQEAPAPFELSVTSIETPAGTKFYDNHITAVFNLANSGGYFNEMIAPAICNAAGKMLDIPDMKYVEILPDGEATVPVDIYTTLPPGTYNLRLGYLKDDALNLIYGTGSLLKFTLAKGSGIDGVTTTAQGEALAVRGHIITATAPVRIYSATGALVATSSAASTDISHLAPGIYIASSGANTLRFVVR